MALMQVSHVQGRIPVTVFQIQEHIHLENFSQLEKLTREAYDNGTRNLVVDLSVTEMLTSIGLRALVVIHKILAKEDNAKHLKVAGATTIIREIMQVTGITQFIEVYDTVDEAVASF